MRQLPDFRNPAVVAIALCLALGGVVRAGGTTHAFDSPQSPGLWQPVRYIAATAPTARAPQARAAHTHRAPVLGLKFAGFQAAALLVSALSMDRRAPFPRIWAVTPRNGRSPPLSSPQ